MILQDTVYPPIKLLNNISLKYPNVWEKMEQLFHNCNGKNGLPVWPDWCYAPISSAIAIVTEGKPFSPNQLFSLMYLIPDAQCIAALAPWNKNKSIFILDKETENSLCEKAMEETDFPSDIIMQISSNCFFVETNLISISGKKQFGFFFHLEFDVNDGSKELRFLFMDSDCNTTAMPLNIETELISDSFQKILVKSMGNLGYSPTDIIRTPRSSLGEMYSVVEATLKALKIVAYICSKDTDIIKINEQKQLSDILGDSYNKFADIYSLTNLYFIP